MYFENIPVIPYEGPASRNPLAFKFYNADQIVLGKPMREHLPFAMAWWHNLCAAGTDMFGRDTADKSFGVEKGTMEHAKAKVDAGFEFMRKLGIEYFCFHDVDLIPEADDLKETNRRLDEITDYILEKMHETGIKCLWGTANMFSNPRFMNGAGSTNSADVFCFAAAQVKKALELTVKLGGRGYVFWGGREGYETLLNTDVKFEQENIAALMRMAVDYGRSIGFTGDFYIEPKPKEPMKHQYDFDAATAIGFLRYYGLDKDFKMNIEANHATLAGHTFQHDLRISAINGMLGSIDANQGDYLLGWDTDEFPFDVYETTMCMYEVLKAGGLTGGFNFDAPPTPLKICSTPSSWAWTPSPWALSRPHGSSRMAASISSSPTATHPTAPASVPRSVPVRRISRSWPPTPRRWDSPSCPAPADRSTWRASSTRSCTPDSVLSSEG